MKSNTIYLITAFVIAFAVLLLVPLWYMLGAMGGGHGGHAMTSIEQVDYFNWRLAEQTKKYGQPDGSVRITDNGDVYIMARQYAFIPRVIRLETGKKYNLHFYSPDVIHGASVIQIDQDGLLQPFSLNMVLPPGPMAMLTIQPSLPGNILLACTEYCGPGHQLMQSRIIVDGEPYPMAVVPWYQRIGLIKMVVPAWLHHDLYIDQVAAVDPDLIWRPPAIFEASGLFMSPHGNWDYWHYHGPSEREDEFLRAADIVDGRLDGRITPGTPGVPAQFIEDFNLPTEKTKISKDYLNQPTAEHKSHQ